ncbi:hypothetical protein D3C81_1309930 [compost metagenome]
MFDQLSVQFGQQLTHPPRQAVLRILLYRLDQSAGCRDAKARFDQTELAQQATDLVGLVGLLLGTLHFDVAHVRTAGSLTDRLRIVGVVLAALEVGFDELRRDQPYFVPQHSQLACPVVRATAGLHGYLARLKLTKEVKHLRALELLAADHLLVTVDAMNLEHLLCQIDADSLKFHGDSLLR